MTNFWGNHNREIMKGQCPIERYLLYLEALAIVYRYGGVFAVAKSWKGECVNLKRCKAMHASKMLCLSVEMFTHFLLSWPYWVWKLVSIIAFSIALYGIYSSVFYAGQG
jgi:hypothetical protein